MLNSEISVSMYGLELPKFGLQRGDILVEDGELPLEFLAPAFLRDGLRVLRDLVELVLELVPLQVQLQQVRFHVRQLPLPLLVLFLALGRRLLLADVGRA